MRGLAFGLDPFPVPQPVQALRSHADTGTVKVSHHTTPNRGTPMQHTQTAPTAIPAGTPVQTPSGRRAVTLDDSTTVRNSETGVVTMTNLVKFSADDEACPGGEWLWNTSKLTQLPIDAA